MTECDGYTSAAPPEPFITLKSAAEKLHLPEFKLRRAIKAGLIPSYQFANRRILVRLSEIIRVIERSSGEGMNKYRFPFNADNPVGYLTPAEQVVLMHHLSLPTQMRCVRCGFPIANEKSSLGLQSTKTLPSPTHSTENLDE